MRIYMIGLCLFMTLVVGAGVVVGFLPISPSSQHVEQRIPDAQIAR